MSGTQAHGSPHAIGGILPQTYHFKDEPTAKEQPPGKNGQPLCFHTGHFTLPDVFPHLFPAYYSPLRALKRFSMAFELERVPSANPSKECGRKTEFGYWEIEAV